MTPVGVSHRVRLREGRDSLRNRKGVQFLSREALRQDGSSHRIDGRSRRVHHQDVPEGPHHAVGLRAEGFATRSGHLEG
jgi:hypothetical protein